jgi:hypothetical protein
MINEAFGAAVRHELDSRGLSLRQARIRTGVDIETTSRMRQGEVPRMDKVIAFARGFHLDVNDWLRLAGYEPIEPDAPTAVRALLELTYEPEGEAQVKSALGYVPAADRERLRRLLGEE